MNICECGCGAEIPTKSKNRGEPMRFKHGHNTNSPQTHPHWKGGMVDESGYVLIFSPNHPVKTKRQYVLQHRLVMEKYLGRHLKAEEIVHHINGNKRDNRIENLEIFNRGSHCKHHNPRLGTSKYQKRGESK